MGIFLHMVRVKNHNSFGYKKNGDVVSLLELNERDSLWIVPGKILLDMLLNLLLLR